MKTKIILTVIVLFSVFAFILSKNPEKNSEKVSTNPPPNWTWNGDIKFLIGAHSSGNETDLHRLKDTLGFNLWLRYLGRQDYDSVNTLLWYSKGWSEYDDMFYDGNHQSVKDILDDNWDDSLKTIMHRPKIEWLAFGSRSDYQCEDSSYLVNYEPDLKDFWFYTYRNQNTVGINYTDGSEFNYTSGKYCSPNYTTDNGETFLQMNPGYVVSGLKANREQINTHNYGVYGQPYPGFGDRQFDWYILPRIRIDSNDAYANKKVCRIDIFNFNGDTILKKDIYGRHFRNQDSNYFYNGKYIEEFYQGLKDSLKILANKNKIDSTNAFNPDGRYKFDTNTCYVDFRVWWYGECDMWLDRIRVEDDRAYNLFNPGAPYYDLYQRMLTDEKNLAEYNGSPYRFYTEEYEIKHLPCMKKVYDKIRESGVQAMFYGHPGGGWYGDVAFKIYTPPADLGVEHYIHHFIDSLNPKDNFYGDYPMIYDYWYNGGWGNFSKIPNTLPNNGPFSSLISVSPVQYDGWLQLYLDEITWFILLLKEGKQISDSRDVNLISPIQVHSLHGGGDGSLREPTNEEIEMMVNTSLTYGSKGIIYNQYISWGPERLDSAFSSGLMERYNIQPRYINDYGELKWQKVIDIDKKLKKWGSYLMSFKSTNTHSYIYKTEKSSLTSNTYIKGIKTYNPAVGVSDTSTSTTNLTYNAQDSTYVQVAVFDVALPETYVKYFMLVNRRCSPCPDNTTTDKIGGRRIVTIDLSGLPSFNNWKLINLETNSVIKTFDKNNTEVNLGNFQPGEGKLYKLVPVMVTGGNLICNENFSNVNFTNDSTVNGNGYDITNGGGTTINFKSRSGIVMDGGTFRCGFGVASNTLQGASTFWNGLDLNNCDTIDIQNTTFKNIADSTGSPYGIKINNGNNITINNNIFDNNSNDGFITLTFLEESSYNPTTVHMFICSKLL